jgi:hypothetical protein
MAKVPPVVRQMILCDETRPDPANPRKIQLLGLTGTIRAKPPGTFPVTHPELCVYIVLTGGVGTGAVRVVIVEADTDRELLGSEPFPVSHPADRHHVTGIAIRMRDCVFPRPGLYWVEFRHDGDPIARQPLIVR